MRTSAFKTERTEFYYDHTAPDILVGGLAASVNILSHDENCPLRKLHKILDLPADDSVSAMNMNSEPLFRPV